MGFSCLGRVNRPIACVNAMAFSNRSQMNSTSNVKYDSSIPEEPSPLPFVLPLVILLLSGMFSPSFEPLPTPEANTTQSAEQLAETVEYITNRNQERIPTYVLLVAAQVVIGIGLFIYFYRTYFQHFPLRATLWSLLVGIVGCVLWIAICKLSLEHSILHFAGMESWLPKRAGFDPGQIESQSTRYLFLVVRFLMLALLIPIYEEMFLRGWLIRVVDDVQWWSRPLAQLSLRACAVASIYGVATHPGEAVAAFVWFSLVTILMKRTGNFWDCVVAHMTTNLLLGIWVLYSGDWYFW